MFHPHGPTVCELARQVLSSTERGYDLLAPTFDYTPFRTPDAVLGVIAAHLRPYAPIPMALDVCCGTGAALQRLRSLVGEKCVGIDMSRGMLAVARSKTTVAPGTTAVEFVRGNALAMPFDAAFDLAVCVGAHGHILRPDEPRFVAQIARVLKPGGRFVCVTSDMPPVWSKRYWFCRAFNAAMHIRNFFVRPPFIMYYLTFRLSTVQRLLEKHGFAVEVRAVFTGKLARLRLVIATLKAP